MTGEPRYDPELDLKQGADNPLARLAIGVPQTLSAVHFGWLGHDRERQPPQGRRETHQPRRVGADGTAPSCALAVSTARRIGVGLYRTATMKRLMARRSCHPLEPDPGAHTS